MSYYGTVAEADTYHANRGNTKWAEAAEASPDPREGYLTRASDYVDSYRSRFAGRKTGGRAQEREWPRADATDASGESIPDDEIPYEIEYATYEAARAVLRLALALPRPPPSWPEPWPLGTACTVPGRARRTFSSLAQGQSAMGCFSRF